MQGGCRRGRAEALGGASRFGRCWAPPGSWVARLASRWRCETGREVNRVRHPMAVRNSPKSISPDMAGSGGKFRCGGAGLGERALGEASGAKAKSIRGLRGSGFAGLAWPRRRNGVARGGAVRVRCGGAVVVVAWLGRDQEGARTIKGRSGIWACVPGAGARISAASTARGRGRSCTTDSALSVSSVPGSRRCRPRAELAAVIAGL